MKWGVEQPREENITRLLELNCGGLHQVIRIGIMMKLFYLLLNDPGKLRLVFNIFCTYFLLFLTRR